MTLSAVSVDEKSSMEQLQALKKLCREDAPNQSEAMALLAQAASIVQSLPKYDVVGMDALIDRLRHELRNIQRRTDGLDSINKLSHRIDVSRAHLAKFRDGGMACMNILNRIADALDIRYLVENYETD